MTAKPTHLSALALLVHDYDEAIDYYCHCLGFQLLEDSDCGQGKRWVQVAPPYSGCALVLAKAEGERQQQAVGNQSGGRVFLFLETDNFARDYAAMRAAGVKFTEQPRHEDYGSVAVFEDLYGNRWDLLQRRA